jgi:acyl-coenzyme A thioesterase 13
MCNPLGNLHGGAAATLVDTVTSASLALLATDSFWGYPMISGVSLTLDMQYYNACPL